MSGQLRVKEEECAALQEALAREVAAVSTLQALLLQYYMCVLVLHARLPPSARYRRPHCLFQSMRAYMF